MTLLKLQETYLEYLRKHRRSLATVGLNRRWLGGFVEFCASRGVESLGDLTAELLPAYHQYLEGRLHNRKGRRYAPTSTLTRYGFANGSSSCASQKRCAFRS